MLRPRTRWLALAGGLLLTASIAVALPAHADDSTGNIAGTLTDAGTPVAFASVTLLTADGLFVSGTPTDESGDYAFNDLTPGQYVVDFILADEFIQYAHGKADFASADVITVTAGATTTVDEAVVAHGTVSGHVTQPDGTPAAGELVEAFSVDGSQPFVEATTDADGFYNLGVIGAGDYTISYTQDFTVPTQYAIGKAQFSQADHIHVTTGATTTVDEQLLPTGAISGTLTDHGLPVVGASVNAFSNDGLSGFATTGDDGSYRIVLLADTYFVQFNLPDGRTQFVHHTANAAKEDAVTVAAGPDTVLNETVLPSGTVTGHLLDHDGNPVANASVQLLNDHKSAFTSTDDTGAYTMPAYTGTYRLEFDTPSGSQWANGQSSPGTAAAITVTADQTTTVDDTLAETGAMAVTVKDSETSDPVQSFCVIVDSVQGEVCTDDGTAQIPSVLPGRYIVDIETTGEETTFAQLTGVVVTSGQTTAVQASVIRSATITTRITDAKTGHPVANACLHIVDIRFPSELSNGGACSDADGNVTFGGEGPGSFKLFVHAGDGIHGDQWVGPTGGVGAFKKALTVTTTPGSTVAVPTIKLDKAGSITGTITDAATGQPLAHAFAGLTSINESSGGGGGGTIAPTDVHGQYTMSGLGPYAWTLFFHGEGEASVFSGGVADRDKATPIKVRAGTTTTYDIAMTPGITVTGRVTGPDGTRSHEARVTFFNADTGEEMGDGDVGSNPAIYSALVAGPQKVKVFYEGEINGVNYHGFVGSGPDIATATVFSLPSSGSKTINVTMTQLVN